MGKACLGCRQLAHEVAIVLDYLKNNIEETGVWCGEDPIQRALTNIKLIAKEIDHAEG